MGLNLRMVGVFAISFTVGCSCDGSSDDEGAGGSQSTANANGGNGGDGGTQNTGGGFNGCTNADDCNGGVCIGGECCASEQACGQTCCGSSQVCFFDACITPGAPCHTASDCEPDEYCETALGDEGEGGGGGEGEGGQGECTQPIPLEGKCLPLPPQCDENGEPPGCVPSCEYHPPVGPLDAILEYQWGPVATAFPEYTDVWSTPAVGRVYDANCDGAVDILDPPNLIFVAGRAVHATTGLGTCCHCTTNPVSACKAGVLRMLDGRTGEEIWSLDKASPDSVGFMGLSTAIGDIDLDGKMDIVAVTGEGLVVLIDATGNVTRTSDFPVPGNGDTTFGWGGGLAIADMDHDGFPEIAYGATVFTTTGGAITRAWTGPNAIGGGTVYEALSTFVDLDDAADGNLELLAGRSAYKADGTALWNRTDLTDGFSGVGDFDLDGTPEVVHVANGSLWILDALSGSTVMGPLALPGTGFGGPPTVADFDGDGAPEIGVAKATFYSVLKPNFDTNTIAVLWQTANHDLSSSVTGSSVFDFEGDGRAEVIYADECFLWVFDGQTGAVRFATSHTSFTATESSLVADVDGDGRSELFMVSNGADPSSVGWGCKAADGTPTVVNGVSWVPSLDDPNQAYRGIAVFGDKANSWVGTRTLWNQHTYHVSNICDDRDTACDAPNVYGSIPTTEKANWSLPWLNNFRQNVQDGGIFNAPDGVLTLAVICSRPLLAQVSLRNLGLASLPEGVQIGVFAKQGTDVLVGQGESSHALFPGQTEVIEIPIDESLANSDDTYVARILIDPENVTFHECREDNNESPPAEASCAE